MSTPLIELAIPGDVDPPWTWRRVRPVAVQAATSLPVLVLILGPVWLTNPGALPFVVVAVCVLVPVPILVATLSQRRRRIEDARAAHARIGWYLLPTSWPEVDPGYWFDGESLRHLDAGTWHEVTGFRLISRSVGSNPERLIVDSRDFDSRIEIVRLG